MDHLYDKYVGKLKHEAVKLKREAKRIAELETPLEKHLREATSNQNWGCPNSVLYALAVACESYPDRQKVMKKIWERLQSGEDKWRRVLKTLMLLDAILKHGPEQVAMEVQSEQSNIRRLVNFQCVEQGQDRGGGIRERAQALLALLADRDLLAAERRKAKEHQAKLSGTTCDSGGTTAVTGSGGSSGSGISRSKFEEKFNELKQKRDKERAERNGDPLNELNTSERDTGRRDSDSDREGRANRRRGSASGDGQGSSASRTQDTAPRLAAPGAAARRSGSPSGRAPAKNSDSSDDEAERPRNAVPLTDLLDMCDGPSPSASAAARQALPVPAPVAASAAPACSGGLDDLLGESAATSSPAAAVDLFEESLFQSAGPVGAAGNSAVPAVPFSSPGSGQAGPWAVAPAQAPEPQEDLFGSFQQTPTRPAQPVPGLLPQGVGAPVASPSPAITAPLGVRPAVPVPAAPVRATGAGEEDPVRRNLLELNLGSGQDVAAGKSKGTAAPAAASLDLGDPFELALGGHR